jgi:hypothetical protein
MPHTHAWPTGRARGAPCRRTGFNSIPDTYIILVYMAHQPAHQDIYPFGLGKRMPAWLGYDYECCAGQRLSPSHSEVQNLPVHGLSHVKPLEVAGACLHGATLQCLSAA